MSGKADLSLTHLTSQKNSICFQSIFSFPSIDYFRTINRNISFQPHPGNEGASQNPARITSVSGQLRLLTSLASPEYMICSLILSICLCLLVAFSFFSQAQRTFYYSLKFIRR